MRRSLALSLVSLVVGGAIFFVSNDRSGSLVIQDSILRDNKSDGFETKGFPGIFVLAKGDPSVSGSTLTP